MNDDDIRRCITQALDRIAPDVDPDSLRTDRDLVDEAGLDSMDFLNLMTTIETELSVTVPEADYHLVRTIDTMVVYLRNRVDPIGTPPDSGGPVGRAPI